jgi:superfamily II DNA or RNA helicase
MPPSTPTNSTPPTSPRSPPGPSAPPTDVRPTIAHAWLTRPPVTKHTDTQLGTITLHPHQLAAATRIRAALRQDGGALLADETGLGKTYVALAIVAHTHHPLIVTPANLKPMWRDALRRADLHATIQSTESLSTTQHPATNDHDPAPDLVVVDEAHYFRNPRTRRYAALAQLTTHTPVLLLSATPIHNRHRDLAALLALFLGQRARTMDDHTLARYVVRRTHDDVADTSGLISRPRITPPRWLTLTHDDTTLQELVALPSPIPPSDGHAAGTLATHALVRQWASSTGTLLAALNRRLERATALTAALEHGHYPTYRDLHGWCLGDGSVQLAFPELLVPSPNAPSLADAAQLLVAVQTHARAVRTLRDRLAPTHQKDQSTDAERAEHLRQLRAHHPHAKIVAFTAYEDTVRTLARHLARDPRVCALTARGARIAGGRLTRRHALALFAPIAQHAAPPRPSAQIDLLITTDLLSEGVNLQDATVVVHLDLPWTPARLEQRVGRVARLGSPHTDVFVYAMQPPASSEALLGLDRLLRAKLAETARAVGLAGSILPLSLHPSAIEQATAYPPPTHAMRATLEQWLENRTAHHERSDERGVRPSGPTAGAVRSARDGYLAVCIVDNTPYLAAAFDGPPTDDGHTVAAAVAAATGDPIPPDLARADQARLALHRWIEHRHAEHLAGLPDARFIEVGARRLLLRRIAQIVRRTPRDRRPTVAELANAARQAVSTPLSAGIERQLEALVSQAPTNDDDSWLRAVAQCAPGHHLSDVEGEVGTRIVALLLLQR